MDNAADARPPADLSSSPAPAQPSASRPLTLLYVEDEENDVLFMRRAIDRAGLALDLRNACDGDKAVDYLAASPHEERPLPALVLLDLNLPARSGFEVLEWIRGRPELRGLPVVVISSSGRPEDRARARALGADDYVVKPTSPMLLVDIIGELWTRWLAPRDGAGAPKPGTTLIRDAAA
jgi:CheY-like chemotaxis protein